VKKDFELEVKEKQLRRTQAKTYFEQLLKQIKDKEKRIREELDDDARLAIDGEQIISIEKRMMNTIDLSNSLDAVLPRYFHRKRDMSIAKAGAKMSAEEFRINRQLLEQAREYKRKR
jgi:hypothetical protein